MFVFNERIEVVGNMIVLYFYLLMKIKNYAKKKQHAPSNTVYHQLFYLVVHIFVFSKTVFH